MILNYYAALGMPNATQKACVRWGSVVSDNFLITNGVRQGGILSPLFLLVWTTSWTPALGGLLVCVCIRVSEVMTPYIVTSSNVELRNYVISRQNFIKSSYVITYYLFGILSNSPLNPPGVGNFF